VRALAYQAPQGSLDASGPGAALRGRRERQVLTFGTVTFVAQRRHGFVVTEQHRHATAARARLTLQTEEQRQCLHGSITAIEEITNLHQLRTPADPLEPPIDELRAAQNVDQRIVRRVQVTNRNDPRARHSNRRSLPGLTLQGARFLRLAGGKLHSRSIRALKRSRAPAETPLGWTGGPPETGAVTNAADHSSRSQDGAIEVDGVQSPFDSRGARRVLAKGVTVNIKEIANQLVEWCNAGKNFDVMRTMYTPDIVSVENDGQETVGQQEVIQKSERWAAANIINGQVVRGPFFNGPDQFAAIFTFTVVRKATGKPETLEEVAVYTVKGDKIAREQFFYEGEH
jgi:hypothetical protein